MSAKFQAEVTVYGPLTPQKMQEFISDLPAKAVITVVHRAAVHQMDSTSHVLTARW
jgi:Holliday junction resolvasome RuvABC ATP-dependent DNA helicase subunit